MIDWTCTYELYVNGNRVYAKMKPSKLKAIGTEMNRLCNEEENEKLWRMIERRGDHKEAKKSLL